MRWQGRKREKGTGGSDVFYITERFFASQKD
jgi:hypothetical protein